MTEQTDIPLDPLDTLRESAAEAREALPDHPEARVPLVIALRRLVDEALAGYLACDCEDESLLRTAVDAGEELFDLAETWPDETPPAALLADALHTALGAFAENGNDREALAADAERLLRMMRDWVRRDGSAVIECRPVMTYAVDLLAGAEDGGPAVLWSRRTLTWLENALDRRGTADVRTLAAAYGGHGHIVGRHHGHHAAAAEYERAFTILEEAVTAGAAAEDPGLVTLFVNQGARLCGLLEETERLPEAVDIAARRVAVCRRHEHPRHLAEVLDRYQHLLARTGELDAAVAATREMITALKDIGFAAREYSAERRLAELLHRGGDEQGALDAARRALVAAETLPDDNDARRSRRLALRDLVHRLLIAGESHAALVLSDRELAELDDGFDVAEPLAEHRLNVLDDRVAAFNHVGRHEDAVHCSAEVLRGRELSGRLKSASVANVLRTRLLSLSHLNRHEEALACAVSMTAIYRDLASEHPGEHEREQAEAHKHRADVLSRLGRYSEALAASKVAVRIREERAADGSFERRAELADALNGQVTVIQAAGRGPGAWLETSRRCVELFERLATERPGTFLGNHAYALRNHSICLGDLGRHREAAEYSARSIEVCEHRSATRPETHADCLDQHAMRLNKLGFSETALEHVERATEIYRELVAQRPEFTANAGKAVSNHARILQDLGRFDEAVEVSRESLRLLEAGEAEPHSLGTTLLNLGCQLMDAGRHAEAEDPTREAIRICDAALEADDTAERRADAARPYANLAIILVATGNPEEALPWSERAVALCEEAVAGERQAHLPQLASTLGTHADGLDAVGDHAGAADTVLRGAELYATLAEADGQVYGRDFARALRRAAWHADLAGRHAEADGFTRRQLDILTALTETDPERHTGALAEAYEDEVARLMEAGRRAEARAVAEEEVGAMRELADLDTAHLRDALSSLSWTIHEEDEPERLAEVTAEALAVAEEWDAAAKGDRYGLAAALDDRASALAETGDHLAALDLYGRARGLWEDRIGADGTGVNDLAWNLAHTATSLEATGRTEEAMTASARALDVYRWNDPGAPGDRDHLAYALRERARLLAADGRREEAVAAASEAVELFTDLAAEVADPHERELAKAREVLKDVGYERRPHVF